MSELLYIDNINLTGNLLKEVGGIEFESLDIDKRSAITTSIGAKTIDSDEVELFKINHPEFILSDVYQTLNTYNVDDVDDWDDYLLWLESEFDGDNPVRVPWSDSVMVDITAVDLSDLQSTIVFQLNNVIYKMITDSTSDDSWNLVQLANINLGPAIDVIDDLDSSSPTDALSANQGRILQSLINAKPDSVSLQSVAFSGSYNDLVDKPYIPNQYVLPIAQTNKLGGIKPDGTTIQVDSNGVATALIGSGSISYNKLDSTLQSVVDYVLSLQNLVMVQSVQE